LFGLLPFALLLPPPIARNLLSASQVRLLAKPIPQACAGCAALSPAPRSRLRRARDRSPSAHATHRLQRAPSSSFPAPVPSHAAPAAAGVLVPAGAPGCPTKAQLTPLFSLPLPLTLFAVGLPASCSIAPARRTSAAAWEITATWHVCNGDLGMVPPPLLPFLRLHSLALTRVPPAIHVHYCAQRRWRRRQLHLVPFNVLPGAPPPLPRPALRHRPQTSRERRYRRRQPAAHRDRVRHRLSAAAGHSPRPRRLSRLRITPPPPQVDAGTPRAVVTSSTQRQPLHSITTVQARSPQIPITHCCQRLLRCRWSGRPCSRAATTALAQHPLHITSASRGAPPPCHGALSPSRAAFPS